MDKYRNLKLENQLCFSLYAASREIIRSYKPVLDQYNLTYTQYITLLVIWQDEEMTVKEIGQKLHLDSGTLTPLLKKLEKMELVSRIRDSKDERVVNIILTEKGRLLKEEMIDVPIEVFKNIGITQEEYFNLKNALDNLLVKLSE